MYTTKYFDKVYTRLLSLKFDSVIIWLRHLAKNPLNHLAHMLRDNLSCLRYNNKTYRVDDINWDAQPSDTFQLYDGSSITFADYYKKVKYCHRIDTTSDVSSFSVEPSIH